MTGILIRKRHLISLLNKNGLILNMTTYAYTYFFPKLEITDEMRLNLT
jgi:hypothetical protein